MPTRELAGPVTGQRDSSAEWQCRLHPITGTGVRLRGVPTWTAFRHTGPWRFSDARTGEITAETDN